MQNKSTIIIPSAKIIPMELQKIGKLPAIIYPINQRIIFEYLYEQYHQLSREIKIVCYENVERVQEIIDGYQYQQVEVVTLPKLGDLAYTIYYALQEIEGPVIVNFADTIVTETISHIKEDSFYYAEDEITEMWTYFEEKQGVICTIYDKVLSTSLEVGKLFVGVFHFSDAQYLRQCLERALHKNTTLESNFYYALNQYSKAYPLHPILAEQWLDIGHESTYYNTKMEVKAREFNNITVDKERGILTKTSRARKKFVGEILWYLNLPEEIQYVRPRIFSYSALYENPYVVMEYYAYHTIHELYVYGDLNRKQWQDIFKRIQFVIQDFARYQIQETEIQEALYTMYLGKTRERFADMRQDESLKEFFIDTIKVNGVRYRSLNDVASILEQVIPELLFECDTFHIIHGDLCFANIMIDSNFTFIKVVDPRGKFGEYGIYGDQRYELAKLFHSLDGKYDYIIKDHFQLIQDERTGEIQYTILEQSRAFDLFELFKDIFQNEIGECVKAIQLIEALLFLSMPPLHSESVKHQYAMIITGLQILDRIVDIKAKEENENV